MERAGLTRDTLERDITREVVSLLKQHVGRGPVGTRVYVHDDVRDQVLNDAQTVRETFPDKKIDVSFWVRTGT